MIPITITFIHQQSWEIFYDKFLTTLFSYSSLDYIASGGFSNYFGMPDYQMDVVQKYLANKTALPPQSFFNSSGRAIPDIASFSGKLGHMLLS